MNELEPVSESESEDSDGSISIGFDDAIDYGYRRWVHPGWATVRPAHYLAGRLGERPNVQRPWEAVYGEVQVLNTVSLDDDGPQCRLLQIDPGAADQPLTGKLIRRPIFDGTRYVALSYSWGRAGSSRTMMIGGISFPVSVHLWKALRRLRGTSEITNVWVDAICINQQNPLDKASQVPNMARIYNAADKVKVWLGDAGPDGRDDVAFFSSLCRLDRPWWRRLWIIQECAYARACPEIMVGDLLMSLQEFIQRWSSAAELCHAFDLYPMLQENLNFIRMPYDTWLSQIEVNHRIPLLQRLYDTREHQCQDPRDKIYALLNLIPEDEARKIEPDYRKSFHTLQEEVKDLLRDSAYWNQNQYEEIFYSAIPAAQVLPPIPAYSSRVSIVFNEGADSDTTNDLQATEQSYRDPLSSAASAGDTGTVELLLERGADVLVWGGTALGAAARAGQAEVVGLLLRAIGPVGDTDGEYEARRWILRSALYAASADGRVEVVRALLAAGAEVDVDAESVFARQSVHRNVLYAAAAEGHGEVVKLLLEAGADVNVRILDGRWSSAFQAASAAGYEDVMRLLLDAGADINV